MNDKALNLLGMARRADKISLGHDASVSSVKSKSACACVLSADSSQRLKDEMKNLCSFTNSDIAFIESTYTMAQLGISMGTKTTAVFTVNDSGFAQRFIQLTRED